MALITLSLTTWQGGARYALRRTHVDEHRAYESREVAALWVPRYTTPPTFAEGIVDLVRWAEGHALGL